MDDFGSGDMASKEELSQQQAMMQVPLQNKHQLTFKMFFERRKQTFFVNFNNNLLMVEIKKLQSKRKMIR